MRIQAVVWEWEQRKIEVQYERDNLVQGKSATAEIDCSLLDERRAEAAHTDLF